MYIGLVKTFAGTGFFGLLDGPGTQSTFNLPGALAVDTSKGTFFVVDGIKNSRIRKIQGIIATRIRLWITRPCLNCTCFFQIVVRWVIIMPMETVQ